MLSEEIPISAVSEKLQFADVPSFCKAFKTHFNMTPKKYQQMMTEEKKAASAQEGK